MAKRNKFSLSHYKLASMDMGELVPVGLVEVLPGDSMQMATHALVRASPLLAPVMHPVDVRIHHWFVPHRLVWVDWEKFITGGPTGTDASVFPTMVFPSGVAIGSLGDYLGLPSPSVAVTVSALPWRAYATIWNEYYRDQDLETPLVVSTASGVDSTTNVLLQNCDWEKDYFTTARPWEQKGPSVNIPLGGTGKVLGIGIPTTDNAPAGSAGAQWKESNLAARTYTAAPWLTADIPGIEQATGSGGVLYPNIRLDMANTNAGNVMLIREAFAMQRYEEARARYGSRYSEYLRYLGVRSSDARLNRPEYLGGGRNTIQFSEVLSTNGQATGNLAALGGHGINTTRSNRFRRFFEEHGYIVSLMSVRPKTVYSTGVRRTWNRRTKEDFWQKEYEHIGQQEVLQKEIHANSAQPDGIFGYQDRYDEYRREESWISGEFRSSLSQWHFARGFVSEPALNASFVKCVPSELPFATPANDVLWVMIKHSIQARRLVSRTANSFAN